MQKTLFIALMLISAAAQAGLYKCKTAEGKIAYSDHPCEAGAAGSQMRSSQGGVFDVDAVPLPGPHKDSGRKMYEKFLTGSSPRVFIICKDGTLIAHHGNEAAVKERVSNLPAGCAPYAINDAVVWKGN